MWLLGKLLRKLQSRPVKSGKWSWLSRGEIVRFEGFRATKSTLTLDHVFVKDNGHASWVECQYREGTFTFDLKRSFVNFPRDWQDVAEIATELAELTEAQRADVHAAVAAGAQPGGCYTLSVTPQGYCLRNCVGDYRTVVVAEGTF